MRHHYFKCLILRDFILTTDASHIAISAVFNQRVNGELAPIVYYSRLLSLAETRYSTYDKECLALVFGCEKARTYLEHKEFELHCDNLALCWLFRNVKEVGRLGRRSLRLEPFKFKICHTKGADNVVADTLSRMFEGQEGLIQDQENLAVLQGLPLVYTSLKDAQKTNPLCNSVIEDLKKGGVNKHKFTVHNKLLCYYPRGAKVWRYVLPVQLRPMLIKYFHDSPMSGHLGAFKTWKKVGRQFFWPRLKNEVFRYVKQCDLCQRVKPAQNMRVGLRTATPASCPLERTKFWTEAIRNLGMAKNRVAKRFNVGRKEAQYEVGGTVLCQRKVLSSKGKGISQKLELKWSVPLVIVRFLKPNVVQLAMPESGVIVRKAHVSQLKPYYQKGVGGQHTDVK